MEEAYYETDNSAYSLTKLQEGQLNDLIDRLNRVWRGELKQIECKGTIERPEKIIDSARVRLEIDSQTNNRLEMHAHIDFREQNKKIIYRRRIFERPDINSFVTNGNDILIVTEKSYQSQRFTLGTVLMETIYKIRFERGSLQFDIITYNNGFFNSEEQWTLR